jgi:tripartite-type tricarboxylate transporter receptor subunit TctC
MAEFMPGYEANGWYGIVAPKGTPRDIVEKLNKEVNAALADPKTRRRFTELGCDVFTGSPADFEKFIESETDKWAKVIKFAGVKAD